MFNLDKKSANKISNKIYFNLAKFLPEIFRQLVLLLNFFAWLLSWMVIFWLAIYQNNFIKNDFHYEFKLVIIAVLTNLVILSYALIKVFQVKITSINFIIYFLWFASPIIFTLVSVLSQNQFLLSFYPFGLTLFFVSGIVFLISQIVFFLKGYAFFAVLQTLVLTFLLKDIFDLQTIILIQFLGIFNCLIFYFSSNFLDNLGQDFLYKFSSKTFSSKLISGLFNFLKLTLIFLILVFVAYLSLKNPIILIPNQTEKAQAELNFAKDLETKDLNSSKDNEEISQNLQQQNDNQNSHQSQNQTEEVNSKSEDANLKTEIPQENNANKNELGNDLKNPENQQNPQQQNPPNPLQNQDKNPENKTQDLKKVVENNLQDFIKKQKLELYVSIFLTLILITIFYVLFKAWQNITFYNLPKKLIKNKKWKDLNRLRYLYIYEYLNSLYTFLSSLTLKEFLEKTDDIKQKNPELYTNLQLFAKIQSKAFYAKEFDEKDSQISEVLFAKIALELQKSVDKKYLKEINKKVKKDYFKNQKL